MPRKIAVRIVINKPLDIFYRYFCALLAVFYFFILLWGESIISIENTPSILIVIALLTNAFYPRKNFQIEKIRRPWILIQALGLIGIFIDVYVLSGRQDYVFDRGIVIIFVITFFILIYRLMSLFENKNK